MQRRIYTLEPGRYSPEIIAVAFAKTSRSPEPFDVIADGLNGSQSSSFHEKWIVGYGHSSVAEHAVLHVALENVSRLVTEILESCRLASFTEKSTRYQKWDAECFFVPDEILTSKHETLYRDTVYQLMQTYQEALGRVREVVLSQCPPSAGETIEQWDRRNRARYVDVCRFLLPSAIFANVGMTINARSLEGLLRKLLSSPLSEARKVGGELKDCAMHTVPTLLKYAEPNAYLHASAEAISTLAGPVPPTGAGGWCRCIDFDADIHKALAIALVRYGLGDYHACLDHLAHLDASGKNDLVNVFFTDLGGHDTPLRELEHIHLTFELLLDQGAYYELKRHRMMTQSPQILTTALGYAVPRLISLAELDQAYGQAMKAADSAYRTMVADLPFAASYVVPNGFRRRCIMTLNLREAYLFCRLRTTPQTHFSARRIAFRLAQIISEIYPCLAPFFQFGRHETWETVEHEYFTFS